MLLSEIESAGAWGLYATTSSGLGNVLASGQLTLVNTWHNLKLRFSGTTITGFVEGNQVCNITNSTYANGMVGFITGDLTNYNTAMFDNLLVNTVGGATPQPTVFARTPLRLIASFPRRRMTPLPMRPWFPPAARAIRRTTRLPRWNRAT